MDLLFIHPNFPGQFKNIAGALARDSGLRVWGLGDTQWIGNATPLPQVELLRYPTLPSPPEGIHPWARSFEQAVRRGAAAMERLAQAKRDGFEPDVIVCHPGWGDAFFVRDFFPGARVIGLFEYFYRPRGADVGFDPEFPSQMEDIFRLHATNSVQLLALESCDVGICPTPWQKSRYPQAYQDKLTVLHEGIDTVRVRPQADASVTLPNGLALRPGDEVLTFVSRALEPYRGFHHFVRALPRILRERPQAQVLVVGENSAHYGPKPPGTGGWKAVYLQEVAAQMGADLDRVHFLGSLPYANYLQVLQISRAHVYLTYPFILSWSMLEAMACECVVLASDTAPVRDVITDGVNGRLFPFSDSAALARMAIDALAAPQKYQTLRQSARDTVVARYDFENVSLQQYRSLMELD